MADFVRVLDKATGSRYTLPASFADDEGVSLVDEPAVDRFGAPLPPSPGPSSDTPSDSWSAPDLREWAVAHGVISEGDTAKKADVLSAIETATQSTTEAQEAVK